MFLCDQCHKKCGCFAVMRSRGTCEGCGHGAACVDCHAHKKPKPGAHASPGALSIVEAEAQQFGAEVLAGKGYKLAES